jgi:hypothetical protein
MEHHPFAVVFRRAGRWIGILCLLAALPVLPGRAAGPGAPAATAPVAAPAMAEYRRKLEEYTK